MLQKNNMLIALMEEYKGAANDYINILKAISEEEFLATKDAKTKDPDCHSIQTITYHIIGSGYTYINYINRENDKEWLEYKDSFKLKDLTLKITIDEINKMLVYTEDSFCTFQNKTNKEIANWSFKVRWGVTYNFEQLMEHAIVHILRHRRQVENFISK